MSKILGKKFDDATVQDVENLVFEISKLAIAESTKNRMIKVLKGFFRWLKRYPPRQFPPEVAWIMTKKSPLITVKPEDLISFEDCIRISEKATNLRDKAIIQCQLDAGCRIGEILTVRVGEVKFNEYGAILNSDGKTGEAPLILTWSARTLAQWLNIHPFRDVPDAPLWCLIGRDRPMQLNHAAVLTAFKKCVRRAGIKKRVWLHLIKHVSCTWDSMRGMPQSYRNFKHHWSANSEMSQVYEHLSSSVIPHIQTWDSKTEHKEVRQEIVLSVKCKRCDYENPRDSKFCNRCTFPLNDSIQSTSPYKEKIELILEKIAQDPEKLEKILALT